MITLLRLLLRLLYGLRAYNQDALRERGPILLVANHSSWWDWVLLGVCLDKDWRFVTSSVTARLSWLHKWIMENRRTFPVDMNSAYAIRHIAGYLQGGGRLVLFPEGRLSLTGSLMKFFDGFGFLILKTRPKIITAYLRGARRLPFSPNPEPKQWFPRLSVHFSDILEAPVTDQKDGDDTDERGGLADWLREQMVRQQFDTEMEFGPATLPEAIFQAARRRKRKVVLQDATMEELTYRRLLLGADLLAGQWRAGGTLAQPSERVGLLLPNTNAMALSILSLWAADKVPAILNYTTGPAVLLACAKVAGLKQVITSRKFIEGAKLDLQPLQSAGIDLIYLEDVRRRITGSSKLWALVRRLFNLHRWSTEIRSDQTAVILFTSGSEADPKGVEMSHANLLSNIRQMSAATDLVETDRFFNALPLFHTFGLTIGLLLPLVRGGFAFLYLSPLHFKVVPSAVYNLDCTVFFSTNTLLGGYVRKADPYDFRSVRYVFAGAEKLQESTSRMWMDKFGIRVLEGYGITECSPCLSVNLPINPRKGSVGKFLPGIEYRLEPVEGLREEEVQSPASFAKATAAKKSNVQSQGAQGSSGESQTTQYAIRNTQHDSASSSSSPPPPQPSPAGRTGRLFVRGPNIMLGYLNPEANAKFKALGGWYDTGDIAQVDADGFVYILGRLKRFAKISGEMVSLTAVEDALAGAFSKFGAAFAVAVVARPDDTKGERLVAVTNEPKLTLDELGEVIRARGFSNLAIPRSIKVLRELPCLGTGKVNHRELERIVREEA